MPAWPGQSLMTPDAERAMVRGGEAVLSTKVFGGSLRPSWFGGAAVIATVALVEAATVASATDSVASAHLEKVAEAQYNRWSDKCSLRYLSSPQYRVLTTGSHFYVMAWKVAVRADPRFFQEQAADLIVSLGRGKAIAL